MRPLLDLCEGAKQIEGARVTLRWWDQPGIDWEKAKAKNRYGIGFRLGFGVRHGGGGGAGHRKQGKRLQWDRMERSECGCMDMKET